MHVPKAKVSSIPKSLVKLNVREISVEEGGGWGGGGRGGGVVGGILHLSSYPDIISIVWLTLSKSTYS